MSCLSEPSKFPIISPPSFLAFFAPATHTHNLFSQLWCNLKWKQANFNNDSADFFYFLLEEFFTAKYNFCLHSFASQLSSNSDLLKMKVCVRPHKRGWGKIDDDEKFVQLKIKKRKKKPPSHPSFHGSWMFTSAHRAFSSELKKLSRVVSSIIQRSRSLAFFTSSFIFHSSIYFASPNPFSSIALENTCKRTEQKAGIERENLSNLSMYTLRPCRLYSFFFK